MPKTKQYITLGTDPAHRWELAQNYDLDELRGLLMQVGLEGTAVWFGVQVVVNRRPAELLVNRNLLTAFAISEEPQGKMSLGGVGTMGARQV